MITYRLNVKRKRKQEAYEKVSIVEKSTEPSTQKEPMSALAYIGALTWDEKLVDQIVIRDTLERILKTTPPYYRSVILYRYTYGMSYYQISRNLGISVIAARQINSRIIRRLRNEILNNFKEDNI